MPDQALGGRVPRRVLAVLAMEHGPVRRDVLAEHVWDGAPPSSWDNALRGAIHRLRRAVDDLGGDDLIRTALGCYELDAEVTVDVVRAAAAVPEAERLLRAGDPAAARLAAAGAAATLSRRLLPGLDGSWLEDRRRNIADLSIRAALVQSQSSTALGDHRAAVAAAQSAVDSAPLLEAVHQRLMAAHAGAGDRAAALVAYERCRRLLVEELGVDPSDQTEAAYVALLGTEPVAPVAVAPVALPASLRRTLALAGRDAELAVADGVLSEVLDGGRHVLLVVGDAGVGKSRLAAEIGAQARSAGAAVVHGRFEPDALLSLGALAEVFGQLGVAWPPTGLAGGAGASADEVRGSLLAAAVAVAGSILASQPLVIVLDDLHWADRATSDLLARLLLHPAMARLLIVATSRGDVAGPTVVELTAALPGVLTSLPLQPLAPAGTAALAKAWARHDASPELVGWLHQRSGGNALFALALLQDLGAPEEVDLATGRAGAPRSGAPGPISDLLLRATAGLSVDACRLLEVAAVGGATIAVDLLAAATGTEPVVVIAHLDSAARRGLVGQSPTDPGSWAFTHHLIVEAILDGLDADTVSRAHRALATALGVHPARDPAGLSRHLVGAGDLASLLAAVAPTVEAAGQAWRQGSVEPAVALATALDARLSAVAGGDAPLVQAGRARLQVALSSAELSREAIAAGRGHLLEAARLADGLGDPSLLLGVAGSWRIPQAGAFDPVMVAIVDRLAAAAPLASTERAVLRCWSAAERAWSPEVHIAVAAAAEAVEVARDNCDPWLLREAIHTWHLVGCGLVDAGERRSRILEAVGLERRVADRVPAAVSSLYLAGDCLELGDFDAAGDALRQVQALSSTGVPTIVGWMADRHAAALSTAVGDWEKAEEALVRAESTASALDNPEAIFISGAQRMALGWHRGGLGGLLAVVVSLSRADDALSPLLCSLAFLHAGTGGRNPSAADDIDRAVDAVLALPPDISYWGCLAMTAEGAAAVRSPRAGELRTLLAPRSGAHVMLTSIAYLGAVDRLLGLLAAVEDDLSGAIDLLRAACEQHRAAGATPYVALTAAELATVLLRRGRPGDRAAAETLTAEARALAERLGLAQVLRLIDA